MHKLYRSYSKRNNKSFQKLKGGSFVADESYEEPGDLDKIISVDRGPIAIEITDLDQSQFTIQGKIVELDQEEEQDMSDNMVVITRRVGVVIENIYPDNPQTRAIKASRHVSNLLLVWIKNEEDVTRFYSMFRGRLCRILGQEVMGQKKKKPKKSKKKSKKKPKKKKPTKKKKSIKSGRTSR